MRSELPAGDVLAFFVDIFSQQHATRVGDRTVGDHLRVFAIDVGEKVVAVLYVLDRAPDAKLCPSLNATRQGWGCLILPSRT